MSHGENAGRDLDPHYQFLKDSPDARPQARRLGDAWRHPLACRCNASLLLIAVTSVGRMPKSLTVEEKRVSPLALVWTPGPGGGVVNPGGGGHKDFSAAIRARRDARWPRCAHDPGCRAAADRSAGRDPRIPPRVSTCPSCPFSSGLQETVGAVSELRPLELLTRGPAAVPELTAGTEQDLAAAKATVLGSGSPRAPGIGGDGERPGNGVSWPAADAGGSKPNYTADAMGAQVEGLVELEILVLEDGSVGNVRIVRSLDSRFGLDQEAINAVRRWRFDPGRRLGKAVATRVGVELSFNLR
jgi:protein TonB